jgi:hypothetical protein
MPPPSLACSRQQAAESASGQAFGQLCTHMAGRKNESRRGVCWIPSILYNPYISCFQCQPSQVVHHACHDRLHSTALQNCTTPGVY